MTGAEMMALEVRERDRIAALMEQPNAVFVFGSNRRGSHGGGAAREAFERYGAAWGLGEGLRDRSYALPTKDALIETLPLEDIAVHVRNLLECAAARPDLMFAVTRVGCGLAGLTDEQVAPLFAGAPDNCQLPEGWEAWR